MLLELFFATVLDMSLPEFQPEIDLSGNVIVSEDIDGEFIASEIPFDEITILDVSNDDVSVGLSPDTSNNDDIVFDYDDTSFMLLQSDSNYLPLTLKRNTEIKVIDGLYYIKERSSYNYYIQYVLLSSGVSYDIDSYGEIFIGDSITYDSQVYLYTSNVIVPEHDLYIIQYHHTDYYMNISISDVSGGDVSGGDVSGGDVSGGDVSGGDVSGGDGQNNVDLSSVNNKLDVVILLLRSIRLILLFNFLYPLAMSCVKMIGGKKDV